MRVQHVFMPLGLVTPTLPPEPPFRPILISPRG